MAAQIELKNVSISIENKQIVNDISLTLPDGKIGCLLGPSGCGKTTLLRALAGFIQPSQGIIRFGDQMMADQKHFLEPEQRGVGMVFQDLALFPHLSIKDNITFGIRHWTKQAQHDRAMQLLDLIGLSDHQKKYPHQLSGGQQQRIALIRALAPKPRLLLLDEPFSSQDAERRDALAQDICQLLRDEKTTALFVTHDQLEAFAMADMIGVMNRGQLMQWDSAYNLYHLPNSYFVADFVGEGTLIEATIHTKDSLKTPFGYVSGALSRSLPVGDKVHLLIRPDDFIHDDDSTHTGLVIDKSFRGSTHIYTLQLHNKTHVLCSAPSHHDHQVGETIGLRIQIEHLVIFPL